MSKKYNEDVLVVATSDVEFKEGFNKAVDGKSIINLFKSSSIKFLDRNLAENDTSFKQIIPYILVKNGSYYLSVRRTKLVGESRLAGLRTIGFGGHINLEDVDNKVDNDWFLTYMRGLTREVNEELDLGGPIPKLDYIGIINDNSNDVGQVHLGIIYILDVSGLDIGVRDKNLTDLAWLTLDELRVMASDHENWSQLVIKNL